MENISIWIAENKLHLLLLIRNGLKASGYSRVRAFINSTDVLDELRNGDKPDVLIADESMDSIPGSELLDIAGVICGSCTGILLIDIHPNAPADRTRHICVPKGIGGLHEALVNSIKQTARLESAAEKLVLSQRFEVFPASGKIHGPACLARLLH